MYNVYIYTYVEMDREYAPLKTKKDSNEGQDRYQKSDLRENYCFHFCEGFAYFYKK